MTDAQMETFIWDLAKLGFCWQFITLAGFHCNALSIDLFSKDYAERGAAAYVQLIQREERKHSVETLTHQKWSGSELVDSAKHYFRRHVLNRHHERRSYRNSIFCIKALMLVVGVGLPHSVFLWFECMLYRVVCGTIIF